MIPKIIHYCWFGKGLMPASQKKFIKTWGDKMPKYTIKCWDESNFDIECNAYVKNAYANGKFAFVSDYVRLKALYTEGGFYFDTDIELLRSLDEFRMYSFVSGIEYFPEFEEYSWMLNENKLPRDAGTIIPYLGFLSAAMGSEPGNELIKDVIVFYDSIDIHSPDYNGAVIDGIMARIALKYGFIYSDTKQSLKDNILILPSGLFCSLQNKVSIQSYLLHHCVQSWQPKTKNQQIQIQLDKFHLLKLYKFFTGIKKQVVKSIKRK